jgi:RND superfamily putative drug exporter
VVTGEGFLIGRDEDCDLVLHDDNVSRRHASLSLLPEGRATLVDLGSLNGTFVDGRQIGAAVELTGGEELRFGDSVVGVHRPAVTVAAGSGVLLRLESGVDRGREVPALGEEFVIGRDESSDFVLRDPTVSGRHAMLAVLPDGTAIVTDLGSRNGTFVDGEQIYDSVRLSGGERLRLGDTVISIVRPQRRTDTVLTETGVWLTVRAGRSAGATVKVTADAVVVGRGEDCDLVLRDVKLSRRHASVRMPSPGLVVLEDLGSMNGTFVDGRRIDGAVELRGEERIELGDTVLTFGEGPVDLSGLSARTRQLATIAVPSEALRREPLVSTESLARACARRRWPTVAVWLLAFAAGLAFAGARLADTVTTEAGPTGDSESKQADRVLERLRGPRTIAEFVVLTSPSLTVEDAAFRAQTQKLHREITGLGPDVIAGARHFYQAEDPALVSRDRRATLLPIVLAGDFDQAEGNVSKLTEVVRRADEASGFDAAVTGEASVGHDFQLVAEEDLKKGESIGLAVAFIVLLIVFGTLVASVLPVVLALISIGVALGIATLLGQVMDLSIFVTNMIVGLGLALGIDYALFVLTRYREERAAGHDVDEAIATAGATSSRAVLFSGVAVVLALFGMSLVPDRLLRSMGVGAMLVGTLTVLAALTLMPALLSLLGDRVDRIAIPLVRRGTSGGEGVWARIADAVMRRPVLSLVVSVTLLLVAASPAFEIRTGNVGVTGLPDSAVSKRGFEAVQGNFPAASANAVEIAVDGAVSSAPVESAIARLQSRLAGIDVLRRAEVVTRAPRDVALLSAPLRTDPKDPAAVDAVKRIRDEEIPQAFEGVEATVLVTGPTAKEIDAVALTDKAFPYVLVFVLGLSFLLLMIAFRSIVVPAKAVVMNLLSVGAAYGLIVLVFQRGVGADLLGFQQVDRVEAWVPLFLFAVLFGLSMDYHVFLLSRIRERYNETGDNRLAVKEGVTSTARTITGAALIMVAVFTGFALGDLGPFQQLGFGMAVALTLDATVIRSVLVPSAMYLMGARNWYLPRWLRWLPDIGVEGRSEQPPPPSATALARTTQVAP